MEVSLRGKSVPTNGSGRLLITDISLHNGSISSSDEHALICRSSLNITRLRYDGVDDWYLDPEAETTTNIPTGKRIDGRNDRGWTRNRGKVNKADRVVRLKRVSETPVEGKFTCHFLNDINNNKSLLILYPSK